MLSYACLQNGQILIHVFLKKLVFLEACPSTLCTKVSNSEKNSFYGIFVLIRGQAKNVRNLTYQNYFETRYNNEIKTRELPELLVRIHFTVGK